MENGYGIEYFQKNDESDAMISGAKLYNVYGDVEEWTDGKFVYDGRKFNNKSFYKTRDELIINTIICCNMRLGCAGSSSEL